MNKIKTFFNLNRTYEFDVTDITALIYTICAIGAICGANMTILFFIGATLATAFCWQARKINLVVLNVALWAMNTWGVIQMIIGRQNIRTMKVYKYCVNGAIIGHCLAKRKKEVKAHCQELADKFFPRRGIEYLRIERVKGV